MKNSTIKQHKQIGKELIPPFMQEPMGSVMHLCSWSKERLPEYVWIGLLRDSCITKTDFFNKFYYLKEYMIQTFSEPCDKFSLILKLDSTKKEELYDKTGVCHLKLHKTIRITLFLMVFPYFAGFKFIYLQMYLLTNFYIHFYVF